MTKVNMSEYKAELEESLLTASIVQEDPNGTDYQYEMSPAEEIRETIFDLKDPNNHEMMLACRNCNLDNQWKELPCDHCVYGGNQPYN